MRKAFFDMAISSHPQAADEDMASGDDDREYEAEKVIGHRGEGSEREYHILQKNGGSSMAIWAPAYKSHGICWKNKMLYLARANEQVSKAT